MSSPVPLCWRSFRLPQQPGLYRRLLECTTRFCGKHSIMRILQSLQYSLSRCQMFRAAFGRPFIKKRFCGSDRPFNHIGLADLKHDVNRFVETLFHDAYSNAGQRGAGEAVA